MRNLHKLLEEGHILRLTDVQAGKQVEASHPSKNMTTKRPLEMLYMDVFGPIDYISIGGNKYDLVIIDNYSHFHLDILFA
jgi:hypothetical protein